MENKFFKVTCKCGHVGVKYFIRISFPVAATNGKSAAALARYIPRVKHDHKDAILACKEISFDEYIELKRFNSVDPYLKCECKQEQQMIEDFASRLELEPKYLRKIKKTKRETVKYRLKKNTYIIKQKWTEIIEEEEYTDVLFAC